MRIRTNTPKAQEIKRLMRTHNKKEITETLLNAVRDPLNFAAKCTADKIRSKMHKWRKGGVAHVD